MHKSSIYVSCIALLLSEKENSTFNIFVLSKAITCSNRTSYIIFEDWNNKNKSIDVYSISDSQI